MASPPHPASPPAVDAPSGCAKLSIFGSVFSQTRQVRERKAKGLHPVNELQRFGLLVCCFFCSICVSLTFAFEILSSQFRNQFQLSSGDMSTINTVGLVFCYFLIPYSAIYEYLGPAINFIICGLTGFIGAVCLGLTFQGRMHGNLATITVFYAFLNVAAGLFDSSYISVLFEIFPRNRGPVIGLSKVMTGLGTSILSCLCNTIFDGNVVGFVYFLAAFIAVVSLFSVLFVTLPPYYMNWWRRRGKTEEEIAELESLKPYYERKFVPKARLIVGYVVVLSMIVFFAVEAPVLAYVENVPRGGRMAVGAIAVVLTVCLTLPVLPIPALGGMNEPAPCVEGGEAGANNNNNNNSTLSLDDGNHAEKTGALAVEAVETAGDSSSLSDDLPVADDMSTHSRGGGEDVAMCRQDPRYTASVIFDYFKQPELWLVLAYLACTQPMGILISYNSTTISIALTGVVRSEGLSALYSAFLGVGNSVGRILFGLSEAYVQHQTPGHRKFLLTATMFIAPILISVGGVLVQVMPGNSILLPYIIVYIQNGYNAALAALIFTSLFEKFHNTLYCCGFLVTVFCVIVFNRVLFGVWVDKQHAKLKLDADVECNAKSCVRMPLIVVTVLGALSTVFALILHLRYTHFVHRVHSAAAEEKSKSVKTVAEEAVEPAVPVA